MSESLGRKTVKGVIWSGVERFSTQAVHFLVTLICIQLKHLYYIEEFLREN